MAFKQHFEMEPVVFFVTSSGFGSLVVDNLTAGGERHPPVIQRVFWSLMDEAGPPRRC